MVKSRQIQFAPPSVTDHDIAAVAEVMRSGWLTSGQEVIQFQTELQSYLGAKHVIALSSCTAAMQTCLAYLDLPSGSIVGVPTWTFVSSALVALHTGNQPMLLDIDPDTLNLRPDEVQAAITAGAAAIVGVHFAGCALDPEIEKICAEAEVPLIEDAAHAFGASDHRGVIRGTGTAGACFSFYATKNLTTGEGGAIATDNEALADFAEAHRQHGMTATAWSRYLPGGRATYDVQTPGIKANMTDTAAALGRSQLLRFDEMQQHRRNLLAIYDSHLANTGLTMLSGLSQPSSAGHLAVGLLDTRFDRSQFVADMASQGVSCSVHFTPLHQLTWASEYALVPNGGLPVADRAAPRAVSLPLHPGLSINDAVYVADCATHSLGRQ